MALDRQMTNRQPLPAPERLPLLEPDFDSDPVELAPHRHRHARERRMHLVLEPELANHGCCSPGFDHSSRMSSAGAFPAGAFPAGASSAGAFSPMIIAPRRYS